MFQSFGQQVDLMVAVSASAQESPAAVEKDDTKVNGIQEQMTENQMPVEVDADICQSAISADAKTSQPAAATADTAS